MFGQPSPLQLELEQLKTKLNQWFGTKKRKIKLDSTLNSLELADDEDLSELRLSLAEDLGITVNPSSDTTISEIATILHEHFESLRSEGEPSEEGNEQS